MTPREMMQDQNLTKEQAIKLGHSNWWLGLTHEDVFRLQIGQPLLCVPFGEFQKIAELALGRPVWTHEFANPTALMAELDGRSPPPVSPIHSLAEAVGADVLERNIVVVSDAAP